MKKNNVFATLLFIALASTASGMAPEDNNSNNQWISLAADVILYSTDGFKEFLSYIYPPTAAQIPKSRFELLPKEIQQTIIFLLSKRTNATTLKDAAHAINSLAQVNKQLNDLINDPVFCLQIIKRLAQQFDCSDETAAAALQTQEAKNRLALQKKLKKLFTAEKFDKNSFDQLYKEHNKYVDLNFTYRSSENSEFDMKNTLLIIVAGGTSHSKATKVDCLLKTSLIHINYGNEYGTTALMECVKVNKGSETLKLLCKSQDIIIDLQDNNQSTALLHACWSKNTPDKFQYIEILLNEGADPESKNADGATPQFVLQIVYGKDSKELKLIEEAIKKKHEKK